VLIVEPDSAFALSLASVYRGEGCTTAVAASASEGEREIASRLPDLAVVRAELPDLSGFSLCGRLRRDRPGLPVVLFSSESGPEALAEHARTPSAANAYLAMPLDTAALVRVSRELLASPAPLEVADDALLEDSGAVEVRPGAPRVAAAAEPELPHPPPVPRRVRRSVVTDEDRLFVERTFRTIADRRADLVAESHRRRPPPPRQLLATPEGRLSLLREDLKAREAQIARLAEIWETREQELAHVDERLHEKEVEIQGHRLQSQELLGKLAAARDAFVKKEREHGASIEGLLLEKFSQEKDLIEVVAAKERRINELEREVRLRDDDLARRKVALDAAVEEIARLERQLAADRERAEGRERERAAQLGARETELGAAQKSLAEFRAEAAEQQRAARAQLEALGAAQGGMETELAAAREREAATAARVAELEAAATAREAEADRERAAARQAVAALQARIDDREEAIREREGRLSRLEEEARRQREAARIREEDLAREVQDHLTQIGALERETEQAAHEAESRLAEAEQRLEEARRAGAEELQRREAARFQEAARHQAVVQDAARRIDALQRELARRAPPPGPGPVAKP